MADNAILKNFTIVAEFTAMGGLLFDVITNSYKLPWMEKGESHEDADTLKQVSIGVKLLIIMPFYLRPRANDDAWYWKFNNFITDLAFFKTVVNAS